MRSNLSSGYPHETSFGYSRAVRHGAHVFVSGTTARDADLDGDAYAQTREALGIIGEALAELGAELRHVVRTVVYARDLDDLDGIARAHAEVFGAVRPANTLVEVSRLIPDAARVEIEATAIIDAAGE